MKFRGFTMVLFCFLCMLLTGCLTDYDADGSYRLTVAGDSNSSMDSMAEFRTSWVNWLQSENLLPQVHALKNGTETRENLVWSNGSVVGWSCVGTTTWGANNGLAWVNSAHINNHADGILVVAGTNDLLGEGAMPQDVINCYLNMQAAAEADNMDFFVATTPPVYPPWSNGLIASADDANALIDQLNALVRSTFSASVVVDFDSGFYDTSLYLNGMGLHFNDTGQQMRAQRVLTMLKAAQD